MGIDYYATTIIGCKVILEDLVIKKEQSNISCNCRENKDQFQYCPSCGTKNISHFEITYIPQLIIDRYDALSQYVKNTKDIEEDINHCVGINYCNDPCAILNIEGDQYIVVSFDNKIIYICVFCVSASAYDECIMNEFNSHDHLNKLKLNLEKINLCNQSGIFTIISPRY